MHRRGGRPGSYRTYWAMLCCYATDSARRWVRGLRTDPSRTQIHSSTTNGVGTMVTDGYIVPPSSGLVPTVPPSQRCGLCQNFKQTTLTSRLYKVRTNLYPPPSYENVPTRLSTTAWILYRCVVQGGQNYEKIWKYEKIGKMWANNNSYIQRKWSIVWYFHVKYFTSQLFYVYIFYDRKQSMKLLLGKHELAYVNTTSYSTEFLTTQIKLALPTFFQLLDRSRNYTICNVRAIV